MILIKCYYCYVSSLFLRFSGLGVSRGSPCEPGPVPAHSARNVSLLNFYRTDKLHMSTLPRQVYSNLYIGHWCFDTIDASKKESCSI